MLTVPASAYLLFAASRSRSDEEWKAALRLCQTDTERATLFAMRAGARDSRALEEMQEIYRLDPKNPFLEVLLVKEIQELEEDLLGVEFNDNRRAMTATTIVRGEGSEITSSNCISLPGSYGKPSA
jgi:hypothetical protein